jgi:hypothetical protein
VEHVRFERWRGQRKLVVSVTAAAAVAGLVASVALGDARPPVLKAGNPGGIVFAHGNGHGPGGGGGGTSSPDLVYHGGPVLSSATTVTAIFWGSGWSSPGDKIAGLDTFYGGIGGSAYLGTTTEYTSGSGHVSSAVNYAGHVMSSLSTSRRAPSTSTVLNVVAKAIGNNAVPNGYYPVYSDQPRGGANYCAWHTWGSVNGTPVEFAFFFNLDNDPGCDVSSSPSGQSQGLAALGNVSGHELSESLTDPQLNAWYDKSGGENADKCAWTFSGTPVELGSKFWQIQGNWSNNSYDHNSPSSYLSGTGCIDGNQ